MDVCKSALDPVYWVFLLINCPITDVSKLGGNGHASFYTNAKIMTAYKNYASVIVNRYKGSSAIFSWQLAK